MICSKKLGVALGSTALAASALIVGMSVLGITADAAPPPPPPKESPGKYMGTAQCKKCHEKGLSGRPASKWPRLKENATWAKDDQHAFAYKRLDDEDPPRGKSKWKSKVTSEDIFDAMEEEEDSASESIKCTSCHGVVVHKFGKPKWFDDEGERAVYANEDLQMGYEASEGVSCDGCHGPASGWIKSHEKEHWMTKEFLAAGGGTDPAKASMTLWEKKGIYYSKDLVLWAQQCARCHMEIDTELLDAKHPDLESFELYDQNSRVPPHWRDYSQEADKPEYPGAGPTHVARMWQVGQAVALESALKTVVKRAGAEEPKEKHVKSAVERASSHYAVLKHALAAFPECAEANKALAAALKEPAKGAKAGLKALEGLAYVLAKVKVTKDHVTKIIAAVEADAATKVKGQHEQMRKLTLTALKKVK